jgi:hypothetical protein
MNGLTREEDSPTGQVEVDAAEHLPFEQLDLVVVAFNRARDVGQGESGPRKI